MKKYYIYILTAVLPILWGACNNGDDIDTKHSIFSTEPMEHNGFDEWLLANYRMQDIESDHKYNLVPADYDKSVALAKIIKHVWMEAYTELAGPAFLRSYVPKTFHLIGSPAYDSSGTKVLGTAEGGKNYDPSFDRIIEGKYVGSDWYFYVAENGNSYLREDADAWPEGFVTAYAMSEAREDFVENIAMYVTHDQAYWDNMLKVAGTAGAAIINQKFTIVYNYMLETWGINLDDLREIVLRRQQEIPELDLSTIE